MKIHFDKNQRYQLEAIQAVVDLFVGQHLNKSDFEFSVAAATKGSVQFPEAGIGNRLALTEQEILENLIRVQQQNQLRPDEISTALEKVSYHEGSDGKGSAKGKMVVTDFPNFSVEMETGTGKTYVYLRTIYELNKVYGFQKFVIVVPSVAIREGVLKSLEITSGHFRELYENQPAEYKLYDAGRLTELRNFARSNAIQILVINIDSFAKDANVINQVRESGVKPVEYIQQVKPVVIIDEPQNMETDIRKKAISNLNPLFTLRYSATHRNLYNLVYKLDPVKAYDLGLVKQIEVDSVVARHDTSGAFISVDGFKQAKQSLQAKLTIFVNATGGVQKKQVTARTGDDLYELSGGLDIYRAGFVLNELDAARGLVVFSDGTTLYKGQAVGGLTDQVLQEMIDATVENHFRKEKVLRGKGIKVLSIFFVDRVANYRTYNDQGKPEKGKLARWFEESFRMWQQNPAYQHLFACNPEEVHDGYFSRDKGRMKDSKEGRPTKADDETFKLIMQDKERLLDMATPLRFIFSHSALREGWDNPNVFQICTLNETRSEVKKRQEIGRGLRLCVDQTGTRNLTREVNRLTVIANEAYESFSRALQQEIEEDCGVKFEGRIKNVRDRAGVKLKSNWQEDALFLELWDKIKHRTTYSLSFSTEQLVAACVAALEAMAAIPKPVIYREKHLAAFSRDREGHLLALGGERTGTREKNVLPAVYDIPDLVAYIQSKTALTRDTVTQILLQSGRIYEIFYNPQLFMDTVVRIIQNESGKIRSSSIRYEKLAGQYYDMQLFRSSETEQYLENLIPVKNQAKTLYNYIAVDASGKTEREFAEACEAREDIFFYVKLPPAYQLNTPAGPYHPGWALIKKEEGAANSIFFVADSKGKTPLSEKERLKITCVEKHFEAVGGVSFKVIGTVSDL